MATEKRLIWDVDMKTAFREWFDNEDFRTMNQVIDDIPSVDAVEVVHGRWEDVYGGKYQNKRFRCTVCKEKALFKFSQDELLSWHEEQKLSRYCPNCGADMRERKDNGK